MTQMSADRGNRILSNPDSAIPAQAGIAWGYLRSSASSADKALMNGVG